MAYIKSGKCKDGRHCKYAHGRSELRTAGAGPVISLEKACPKPDGSIDQSKHFKKSFHVFEPESELSPRRACGASMGSSDAMQDQIWSTVPSAQHQPAPPMPSSPSRYMCMPVDGSCLMYNPDTFVVPPHLMVSDGASSHSQQFQGTPNPASMSGLVAGHETDSLSGLPPLPGRSNLQEDHSLHDYGWRPFPLDYNEEESFSPQSFSPQNFDMAEASTPRTEDRRPSKFDYYLNIELERNAAASSTEEKPEQKEQKSPKKGLEEQKSPKKGLEVNSGDELDKALNSMAAGFNRQSSAPARLDLDDEFLDFEDEDALNTMQSFMRQVSAPAGVNFEASFLRLKDIFGPNLNVKNTFLDFGDEGKTVGSKKRSPSV